MKTPLLLFQMLRYKRKSLTLITKLPAEIERKIAVIKIENPEKSIPRIDPKGVINENSVISLMIFPLSIFDLDRFRLLH